MKDFTGPFKSTATTRDDASIWTGTCYMGLIDPNPAEIHLSDIALALSRIARFNGYKRGFYSVAEHCIHCVRAFEVHAAGDVTSPLKAHLPEYKRIEARIEAAISARFGLTRAAPEWVKQVDREMLALEKRLMKSGAGPWPVLEGVNPPCLSIWNLPPEVAEFEFLTMADALGLSGEDEA